jgi:hypothetical protein
MKSKLTRYFYGGFNAMVVKELPSNLARHEMISIDRGDVWFYSEGLKVTFILPEDALRTMVRDIGITYRPVSASSKVSMPLSHIAVVPHVSQRHFDAFLEGLSELEALAVERATDRAVDLNTGTPITRRLRGTILERQETEIRDRFERVASRGLSDDPADLIVVPLVMPNRSVFAETLFLEAAESELCELASMWDGIHSDNLGGQLAALGIVTSVWCIGRGVVQMVLERVCRSHTALQTTVLMRDIMRSETPRKIGIISPNPEKLFYRATTASYFEWLLDYFNAVDLRDVVERKRGLLMEMAKTRLKVKEHVTRALVANIGGWLLTDPEIWGEIIEDYRHLVFLNSPHLQEADVRTLLGIVAKNDDKTDDIVESSEAEDQESEHEDEEPDQ